MFHVPDGKDFIRAILVEQGGRINAGPGFVIDVKIPGVPLRADKLITIVAGATGHFLPVAKGFSVNFEQIAFFVPLLLADQGLKIQWSLEIPNDQFAGAPENLGSQILLTFRSGNLIVIEPSSGKQVNSYALGQPIIHRPTRVGEKMYVSGMDGTVHFVDLNRLSDTN